MGGDISVSDESTKVRFMRTSRKAHEERSRQEAREERRGNHRDSARERRRLEDRIIRREIGLDLSLDHEERVLWQDITKGLQPSFSVRNADRLAELELEVDDHTTWVELLSGDHLDEVSEYYGGTGFRELKIA